MSNDNQLTWSIKERDWSREVNPAPRHVVTNHPLNSSMTVTQLPTGTRLAAALPTLYELDPLSVQSQTHNSIFQQYSTPTTLSGSHSTQSVITCDDSPAEQPCQSWSQFINQLNSCSSTDPNSLVSAYLPPPETGNGGSVQTLVSPTVGPDGKTNLMGRQRITWRLQQLELHERGRHKAPVPSASLGFTPHQFEEWVANTKTRLKHSWAADQRTLALKLAIQCIRQLSVSGPYEFYASKFVLVIDVLDTLADLVVTRLTSQCRVSSAAQGAGAETCRNWWRKVCSIREVLPRFYLQAALLPALDLLSGSEVSCAVRGVSGGVRGVGDGLVNAFLRAYVARCLAATYARAKSGSSDSSALQALPDWQLSNLEEAFRALCWTLGNSDKLNSPNIGSSNGNSSNGYQKTKSGGGYTGGNNCSDSNGSSSCEACVPLLQPLVLYLCCNVAGQPAGQNPSVCKRLVHLACGCGSDGDDGGVGDRCIEDPFVTVGRAAVEYVWVCAVLRALPPHLTALHGHTIALHTAARHDQGVWCGEWCCSVLTALAAPLTALSVPPTPPLPLLAAVLPLLHSMPLPCYLIAAGAWLACTARHCTVCEVEGVCRHVLRRVTAGTITPAPRQLAALLTGMLQHAHHSLCNTDVLVSLLGVVQQWCHGDGAALSGVLGAVLHCHAPPITALPLAHQALALAGAVHAGHSLLTTEDERRHLAALSCSLVWRVALRDHDQHLAFLVSARAALPLLPVVQAALVQAVCRLAVEGSKCSASPSLHRACVANAFISIASLPCPAQRLRLYLLTAGVARMLACHGQADSCLKTSIRELNVCITTAPAPPCPASDCWAHASHASLVGGVAGLVLATPAPPTTAPLYLLRGLVQAVAGAARGEADSVTVICPVISALCAYSQTRPPYTAGTDECYWVGGAAVAAEAGQLCWQLMQQILTAVEESKGSAELPASASQAVLCGAVWRAEADTAALLTPLLRAVRQHPQQKQLLPWLLTLFSRVSTEPTSASTTMTGTP